jgi:hypothetical protein
LSKNPQNGSCAGGAAINSIRGSESAVGDWVSASTPETGTVASTTDPTTKATPNLKEPNLLTAHALHRYASTGLMVQQAVGVQPAGAKQLTAEPDAKIPRVRCKITGQSYRITPAHRVIEEPDRTTP